MLNVSEALQQAEFTTNAVAQSEAAHSLIDGIELDYD